MATALSIITRALQEIGVAETGQSLDAEDTNRCYLALNALADSWLTEPNYMYTTTQVSASLSAGVMSLAIGTGLAINTDRPVRLEDGCYVTVGNIDYPLDVITESEYFAIPIKNLAGPWPQVCYYDGGSPNGNVFFYPTGACTVKLNVQQQLSQFATLTGDYTLPPGYERAFALTLAEEMAPSFRAQVQPLTSRNAKVARRNIKRANFVVPQLGGGSLNTTQIPFNDVSPFDGGTP